MKGKDGEEMVGHSQGSMTVSIQKDLVDRRLVEAEKCRGRYVFFKVWMSFRRSICPNHKEVSCSPEGDRLKTAARKL